MQVRTARRNVRRGHDEPALIVEPSRLVDRLIEENRALHASLERLERRSSAAASGGVETALRALQRRLRQARRRSRPRGRRPAHAALPLEVELEARSGD